MPTRDELKVVLTSSMGHGSAKGHKFAMLEIFGEEASAMMQGSSFALKQEVEWHRRYITIMSLTNLPPHSSRPSCGRSTRLAGTTSCVPLIRHSILTSGQNIM